MSDLSLVSTDELIEALAARCHALAVVLLPMGAKKDENVRTTWGARDGYLFPLMAASDLMKADLTDAARSRGKTRTINPPTETDE